MESADDADELAIFDLRNLRIKPPWPRGDFLASCLVEKSQNTGFFSLFSQALGGA
jgi:hypothetical protein